MDPLTRRSRFILCVAVGLGLGVTIVPNWATNNLWDVYDTTPSGLAGFRSASHLSAGCVATYPPPSPPPHDVYVMLCTKAYSLLGLQAGFCF